MASEASRRDRILIFDGDDTLWETEVLYDRARTAAARVVAGVGVDPAEFEHLQREVDVQNFESMRLSPDRFPTSSVQAYERLAGDDADESISRTVWETAAAVFDAPAETIPGVDATLVHLAEQDRLVLVTKGDRAVQHHRIRTFEQIDVFDGVLIVEQKSSRTFSAVCEAFDADVASSWSIGNSLRSDILTADEAGLRTAWIDAHVWAHERIDADAPARTTVVKDFASLLTVL